MTRPYLIKTVRLRIHAREASAARAASFKSPSGTLPCGCVITWMYSREPAAMPRPVKLPKSGKLGSFASARRSTRSDGLRTEVRALVCKRFAGAAARIDIYPCSLLAPQPKVFVGYGNRFFIRSSPDR